MPSIPASRGGRSPAATGGDILGGMSAVAGPPAVTLNDLPRVLHVAGGDVFDRFGRMLRQVAFCLADAGVPLDVLTDDRHVAGEFEVGPAGLVTVPALSGWRSWGLADQLQRRLAQLPGVVHLWDARALPRMAPWARAADAALLVYASSRSDLDALLRTRVEDDWHVVAACSEYADMVQEHIPAIADRVTVAPPSLLTPVTPVRTPPPADADPPAEPMTGVLWTGRFGDDPGLRLLVDALARVRARGVEMHVVLAGAHDANGVWRAARAARVADAVSLIDEPRLWDQAMIGVAACVLPSRQADLSLAPILAMSLRKVVICSSDQAGEWFVDGRTAWAFPPGDAAKLSELLERVVREPQAATALGESAAQHVQRHHRVSDLAAKLIETYRDLYHAPDAPSGGVA
jgi:glycosyltransferase involved in cell wall biosynthesis